MEYGEKETYKNLIFSHAAPAAKGTLTPLPPTCRVISFNHRASGLPRPARPPIHTQLAVIAETVSAALRDHFSSINSCTAKGVLSNSTRVPSPHLSHSTLLIDARSPRL
jgi:hypothetical protein